MENEIGVSSSSSELMDPTSLRFIKMAHTPTPSPLTPVIDDYFSYPPKSPILGFLDHIVGSNDFSQTFMQIEIMGLEYLGDDLGHVEFPRVSVHDNSDILRPFSYPSLACWLRC